MQAKRMIVRALLLGAVIGAGAFHASPSEATTSVATSTSSLLHTQQTTSGTLVFNAALPNASLKANVLASSGDVSIGIGGVSPIANSPLIGLTSGSGVTQTRGGGGFTLGQSATNTLSVDVTYDITDALPSTSYGYFYTLANLIAAGAGDSASITANLTYTLDKNSVTSPGVNVTKPLFVTKSTTGVTQYNTTVFGYAALSGTSAAATTNVDPHKLRIFGTIQLKALDPVYGAEARVTGPLVEWNASTTMSAPGTWENTTHEPSFSWNLPPDVGATLGATATPTPGITQSVTFPGNGPLAPGAPLNGGSFDSVTGSGTDLSQQSASIEMWIRPNAAPSMGGKVLLDIGNANRGLSITMPDANTIDFRVADGTAQASINSSIPASGVAGAFRQVVAVLDTDEPNMEQRIELYVDGQPLLSTPILGGTFGDWSDAMDAALGGPDTPGNGNGLGAGGPIFDTFKQFEGEIAVVRFYGYALDQHEVMGLFNADQSVDPINAFLTANLPAGLPEEFYHTQGGGFLLDGSTPPFTDNFPESTPGVPEPISASLVLMAVGAVVARRPRRRVAN